jgi:molybdopterin-containing oxidoreductase family iron-sulfur binding subunit
MQNLMLNPDVTIRERGVMEKCTFCVQRIQEGKYEAKRKEVPLADGDIKPACAQSCPAGAINFGDMNDRQSLVSKNINDPRAYRVLEEINTRPATSYLKIVRNRNEGAVRSDSDEHKGSGEHAEHKEATHG